MTDKTERPLCIYHHNCADGFSSAWVVWKYFKGEVDFHPGIYGEEPPETKGRRVIIVDFSYKPDVLKKMSKSARSMLILDHHKSAVEEIKSYENVEDGIKCQLFVHMEDTYTGEIDWNRHLHNSYQDYCENIPRALIYTLFDMERSGAMITWNFFFPRQEPPQLLKHVEDRDLWRFNLPHTREIQACLFSYEYDFHRWDQLMLKTKTSGLISDGQAIERKHHKDIKELVEASRRLMRIGGVLVWVGNLPYTMSSDACRVLYEKPVSFDLKAPFGACYWDGPDGRTFSLRSEGDFDVSEIARKYGGGGHKNASGFRMPVGWEGDTDSDIEED